MIKTNTLLFGASGFIGKNLSNELKRSHKIVEISLRDKNWQKDLKQAQIYINLVGKAHDHNNTATEKDFYHVNVELTKQIFKVFMDSDAELFIHISSLAALEEFESQQSLTEESHCNPNSWYGQSKREAEIWLMGHKLPQGKKLIILRPPMVHGPGDKGNLGLLYKFVLKGIPYPLAAFENRRSFISINNFCFFVDEIIRQRTNLSTGIYHIADDESVSTNEIIEIIKQIEQKNLLNLKLPKNFIKAIAKVGDLLPIPLNTVRLKKMTSDLTVSNQKIKTALGIKKLSYTAEQGLIKTLHSFKKDK